MKNINKSQRENELTDMINKLKEILEYYCSYGERLNTTIL